MDHVLSDQQRRWLDAVFSAKAAQRGGVVRRSLRDVDREVGRDAFLAEVGRRGWSAVVDGGQVVVFCNAEGIRRLA